MKKRRPILALLLVLLLLLSACGGTDSPPGAGQDTPSSNGDSQQDTPVSSRDTINLALNQVVETLNPFASANIVDMQLFCQIYETSSLSRIAAIWSRESQNPMICMRME